MTVLGQQDSITVGGYLAGEEISGTKHEYLDGTVHAMAGATIRHNNIALNCLAALHGMLFVETEIPAVTLHRRLPEGGFTIERHTGLDAMIPLPEIEASLSLTGIYESRRSSHALVRPIPLAACPPCV
jgi:hypothetical protein